MSLSTLLKPVLRLSADEFPAIAAREFGVQAEIDRVWQGLAPVARTLVDSFYTTIDNPQFPKLVPLLDAYDADVRGVAYEGAGMGLCLLDCLLPRRKRLASFIAGPGHAYRPLLLIGAGLVLPRLPVNPLRLLERVDYEERWLILDGCGFYHGFFSPERSLRQHIKPRTMTGYAGRVFDRGLGRSLWFTHATSTRHITATIEQFPAGRRGDLWSGVGLACAYAAPVLDAPAMRRLVAATGPHADQFAIGVAVAAEFRQLSGGIAAHTDLACWVSWGEDGATVARTAAAERVHALPASEQVPPYEAWRERLRAAWVARNQKPPVATRSDR